MKHFFCSGLSVLAAACGMTYGTLVQAASDPVSFDWNGIQVTPELMTGLTYDDNLYRDNREISTPVFIVKPSVDFRAISGLNEYSVQLEATDRTYTDQHSANSTDYGISGDVHHEFNSRNRLGLNAGWGHYFDEGSEIGSTGKLPRYEKSVLGGTYGFGSKETANIDVFANYDDQQYRDAGFNSRSIKYYGSTFYYNLMPKTDALLEISKRELSYDDIQNANYDITNYLVGLRWEGTAKTSGYAKAGRRYRETDIAGIGKEGYTGWELGMSYMPLTYSVVQLTAGRDYGLESDNPETFDFTRGNNINLTWQHDWTGKFSSRLGYGYTDEDVLNASGVTQKERNVNSYNAGIDWKVDRWVTLSLDWTYTKRDETAKQTGVFEDNYNRNTYMLSGRFSL